MRTQAEWFAARREIERRWARHCATLNEGGGSEDDFAVRGNGDIVIFDDEGWFSIGWNVLDSDKTEGRERRIVLKESTGEQHSVNCEPSWLWGYYDMVHDGIEGNF